MKEIARETVVVLFNRDLRVGDHPALAEACAGARHVLPLFVLDPGMDARGRAGFLAECLADLRASLRDRGGDLVVRRGDPAAEAVRLAREVNASAVWASADVTAYARARERRLARDCERERLEFRLFPGVTVVPPGRLIPTGGDHYKVFTPYWRAWAGTRWRELVEAPERVSLPPGVEPGELPEAEREPYVPGGESRVRRRMELWLRHGLEDYAAGHDDLAGDRTSRLSPYLHFGCVSPLELARLGSRNEEFVRQLCWRDFYHQVTYAFPEISRRDYRPRGRDWNEDKDVAQAWREGMTGIPIVDAGMRQLAAEGWMHNRARLIVASYLTKTLGVDWRVGADHFADLLLDADVANNCGNWQWMAGTGNDTRPNRVLNPIRQARKFDPEGEYVRRYVLELQSYPGGAVHEPWRLSRPVRGYPSPITAQA
ncbi:deoxyribodipyrimidine photo-lyase [Acrocarpospora phusangensis]|uniref:Deoxyribodipyrimidine photo-lyase n=1 Tax=Acrocarpospora phusangensis TaxID=1070424 RepID=A0A919QGA3_9ACTN|nr:deoxyribodipyrimidine photo-lyase [Acrocarpospora phusangensis]GIH25692.1 deoxyribodipyrimidine photo-lyase [Acrocarpospora phusangensis]